METIDISKYGLKPTMSVKETQKVLDDLRSRIGLESFKSVANLAYKMLLNMRPRDELNYPTIFTTELEREIFIVVAFRFIGDNMEYTFSDDYQKIKRYN